MRRSKLVMCFVRGLQLLVALWPLCLVHGDRVLVKRVYAFNGRKNSASGGAAEHSVGYQDGVRLWGHPQDVDDAGYAEAQHEAHARALQQKTKTAETFIVTSPLELIGAVEQRSRHIELRSHMDLTVLEPRGKIGRKDLIMDDFEDRSSFAWSIRGNCTTPPTQDDLPLSGSPLAEWKPGQCVLIADVELFDIEVNLWLDNLYVRHVTTDRTDTVAVVWCGSRACRLWMTNVTIQGSGADDPFAGGVMIASGNVYAEGPGMHSGLVVSGFASAKTAMWISSGAIVNLKDTKFVRNLITDTSSGSVICIHAGSYAFEDYEVSTVTRLENCEFEGNTAKSTLFAYNQGKFRALNVGIYSDRPYPVDYLNVDTSLNKSQPLSEGLTQRFGVNGTSSWFLAAQEDYAISEKIQAPESETPSFVPTSSQTETGILSVELAAGMSNDDENKSGKLHAALTGVVAVVCVTVVFLGVWGIMKLRKRRSAATGQSNTALDVSSSANQSGKLSSEHSSSNAVLQDRVHVGDVGLGNDMAPSHLHTTERATGPTDSSIPFSSPELSEIVASPFSEIVRGMARRANAPPHALTVTHASCSDPSGCRTGSADDLGSSKFESAVTDLSLEVRYPPGEYDADFRPIRILNANPDTSRARCVHTCVGPKLGMKPPDKDAPYHEKMNFLHQQLNGFGLERPILQDLVSLGVGTSQRRQGGQGVVQMVRSEHTGKEYAIKFFISKRAFEDELNWYQPPKSLEAGDLIQFLPQNFLLEIPRRLKDRGVQVYCVHENVDKFVVDNDGNALPPCIVMERGESLDIWTSRARPDRLQACMMINHLASRLRDLHALGYVHRDLKPGNVMWLPRENRWTIIDFGCVARAGASAKLAFSLCYAAPEVIATYRRGDKFMVAEPIQRRLGLSTSRPTEVYRMVTYHLDTARLDYIPSEITVLQEAVDVWSLGVMAFELLTGSPALHLCEGKRKVMDRIEGRNGLQLPWEGNMPPRTRRKLGNLCENITNLLSRDPDKRPTAEQFCFNCNQVLAGTSSVML